MIQDKKSVKEYEDPLRVARVTEAIGGQKKPSDDGMPCNGPYRVGQKPLAG